MPAFLMASLSLVPSPPSSPWLSLLHFPSKTQPLLLAFWSPHPLINALPYDLRTHWTPFSSYLNWNMTFVKGPCHSCSPLGWGCLFFHSSHAPGLWEEGLSYSSGSTLPHPNPYSSFSYQNSPPFVVRMVFICPSLDHSFHIHWSSVKLF